MNSPQAERLHAEAVSFEFGTGQAVAMDDGSGSGMGGLAGAEESSVLGLRREVSRGLECKHHVRVGLLLNEYIACQGCRCLYVDVVVNGRRWLVDMTWHGDTAGVS